MTILNLVLLLHSSMYIRFCCCLRPALAHCIQAAVVDIGEHPESSVAIAQQCAYVFVV